MEYMARDRRARRQFRDNMSALHYNRENFHPWIWMTDEQRMVGKTEIVSDRLVTKAMNSAEARGYNRDLWQAGQLYDQADRQLTNALQRVANGGRRIGPARLEAMEKLRKARGEDVAKIEKKRDDAIAKNLKAEMTIYCQQHGLAEAAKLAKSMYWRLAPLLGVEAAARALDKLINDMMKAVVEGKLGMGSF
jgi:hypothetical protein